MNHDSEGSLLYEVGDAVDGGIFLVFVGVEPGLHVHAEEFAECLPETGTETAEEGLDDIERTLVGLAIDQFKQNLALILCHVLHDWLVLLEDVLLEVFEVLLARFLIGDCLDIFVGLTKGGKGEFCVRKCLSDISDSTPVELLLLLILEFHRRIDIEVVEDSHPDDVAIFIHKPVETSHGFDGQLRILLIFRYFRLGYSGFAAEGNSSKQYQ